MSRKNTSSLCFLEQAKFQLPVISNEDSNEMKDEDHFQIKNILVHSNKYSKNIFLCTTIKNWYFFTFHSGLQISCFLAIFKVVKSYFIRIN